MATPRVLAMYNPKGITKISADAYIAHHTTLKNFYFRRQLWDGAQLPIHPHHWLTHDMLKLRRKHLLSTGHVRNIHYTYLAWPSNSLVHQTVMQLQAVDYVTVWLARLLSNWRPTKNQLCLCWEVVGSRICIPKSLVASYISPHCTSYSLCSEYAKVKWLMLSLYIHAAYWILS